MARSRSGRGRGRARRRARPTSCPRGPRGQVMEARRALLLYRPGGQRHESLWVLSLSRAQIGDNRSRIVPERIRIGLPNGTSLVHDGIGHDWGHTWSSSGVQIVGGCRPCDRHSDSSLPPERMQGNHPRPGTGPQLPSVGVRSLGTLRQAGVAAHELPRSFHTSAGQATSAAVGTDGTPGALNRRNVLPRLCHECRAHAPAAQVEDVHKHVPAFLLEAPAIVAVEDPRDHPLAEQKRHALAVGALEVYGIRARASGAAVTQSVVTARILRPAHGTTCVLWSRRLTGCSRGPSTAWDVEGWGACHTSERTRGRRGCGDGDQHPIRLSIIASRDGAIPALLAEDVVPAALVKAVDGSEPAGGARVGERWRPGLVGAFRRRIRAAVAIDRNRTGNLRPTSACRSAKHQGKESYGGPILGS